MKVTVAIDSFKGSLTSLQAGNAVKNGILKVYPDAKVDVCPIADGGEGTVSALAMGMGGCIRKITVTGPAEKPVECEYGIIGNMAVIEMAGAAGITYVSGKEKNPLNTTTYGVGQVIKDAVINGCRSFIIGIGGSATNDGGTGMLKALGFRLYDKSGSQIANGAKGLKDLVKITDDNVMRELKDCTFKIACDVTNPLTGPSGCSAVFGPQKGATPEMIKDMDLWLKNFADLAKEKYPESDSDFPGSGAAGGMGFALRTFLNASLEPGIKIVLNEIGIENKIKEADIVVTGEGRLDAQTVMGKAPSGVAGIAKKYGKPVIAFSGCVTDDASECNNHGIDAFFPILRTVVTLDTAMEISTAEKNMALASEQVFRLIKTFR